MSSNSSDSKLIIVYEGTLTQAFRDLWFDTCNGCVDIFEEVLGVEVMKPNTFHSSILKPIWVRYKVLDEKKVFICKDKV